MESPDREDRGRRSPSFDSTINLDKDYPIEPAFSNDNNNNNNNSNGNGSSREGRDSSITGATLNANAPSGISPFWNPHNSSSSSASSSMSRDPLPPLDENDQRKAMEDPMMAFLASRTARDDANQVLFVRQFPTGVSEYQLESLFKETQDFVDLRKVKGRWFVEFTTIDSANRALKKLRGFRLNPNEKALFLEYDRGKKRAGNDDFHDRRSSRSSRDDERKRRRSRSRSRERSRSRDRSRERHRERSRSRERPSSSSVSSRGSSGMLGYYPTPMSSSSSSSSSSSYRPSSSSSSQYPPPSSSSSSSSSYSSHYSSHHHSFVTLYIGNLPRDVTERELSLVFRLNPYGAAFRGCRIVNNHSGGVHGFVDLIDVGSAQYCIDHLQGFKIDLRDKEGIFVEYDKRSQPSQQQQMLPPSSSGGMGYSSSRR